MNRTGTKLLCSSCGAQVAVTKGGDGSVSCCDALMVVASGGQIGGADLERERIEVDDPFYS